MKTTFVTMIAAALSGSATAQMYVTPPQAMPGTAFQPNQITPAGAFTQGGVVTGQPYYLTPSVMGNTTNGTVVGQPYPAVSTGNQVVGGSYMGSGYYTQSGVTTGTTTYPAGTVYSQPYTTAGTVYSASPYTTYTTSPYTTYRVAGTSYGSTGAASSGLFAAPVRVVNTAVAVPGRVVRRVFRR